MARPGIEQFMNLSTVPVGSDGLPQGKHSADVASD